MRLHRGRFPESDRYSIRFSEVFEEISKTQSDAKRALNDSEMHANSDAKRTLITQSDRKAHANATGEEVALSDISVTKTSIPTPYIVDVESKTSVKKTPKPSIKQSLKFGHKKATPKVMFAVFLFGMVALITYLYATGFFVGIKTPEESPNTQTIPEGSEGVPSNPNVWIVRNQL